MMRYAGESNMKRVALECGGKSPQVVMRDADIEAAASAIAWSIYYNSGETCHAGSRLLVQREVRADLIAAIARVAETITLGHPLDPATQMGALIDRGHMQRVLDYIRGGVAAGAQVVLGGGQALAETGGYYVEATILDRVRPEMRVAREEIFGPVLSVLEFAEESEGVRLANRHRLRPRRGRLDFRHERRAPGLERAARWHGLDQHLRSLDLRDPVRRLQTVRFRPRSLPARARQVHRFQDDLDAVPVSGRAPTPHRIRSIEISHHRLAFEPPFRASWDSEPRTHFDATLVRVATESGLVGYGSGDKMVGFAGHEELFIGEDPLALERHYRVLSHIDFHYGRCWPLDLALWDLAGKIAGLPCWKLLGGLSNRLRAYASSGVLRDSSGMADQAERYLAQGFRAMKVRFHRGDWRDDVRALEAVRARVGQRLDLLWIAIRAGACRGTPRLPGRSRMRSRWRASSSGSTFTGWRNLCTAQITPACAPCARRRTCASQVAR